MTLTLLDIIGLLMIFGCGIIGYLKGAINTLIGLAGFIASFLIAKLFTPAITEYVLNIDIVKNFITNTITQNLVGAMTNQSSDMLASIQGMPGINHVIQAVTASQNTNAADAVVKAMAPIIQQITYFFVFIIILMVCNLLIGFFKRVGRGVNRVPVIGILNRATGATIGLIIGGILFCLLISVLLYYAVFTANLAMVQMVKGGVITGPISIYLQ